VAVSLKEGRSFRTDPQRVGFPPREPTWQSPKHKASLEFSSTTLRIFSEDEIDEASSDTFLPWSPRFFDTDPLSVVHVFGDEVQRKQILDLCEEFRDIFTNELDETPAIVPPFDLKVDETKWKVRANRAPPRPQTTANQADIVNQIKTLLQQGIIETSQASHYSQVLMVPKPDGSRRMCVDFRNLNDCTEDASFPIPHTKQMFLRIGAKIFWNDGLDSRVSSNPSVNTNKGIHVLYRIQLSVPVHSVNLRLETSTFIFSGGHGNSGVGWLDISDM
jgi:hypothetical protein